MKSVTVAGSAAALASCLLVAAPAAGDATLTSQQLTDVVPRVKDVKVFYSNVTGEQAPVAGVGADYIPSQGICVKADGEYSSLNKLAKRQAWSAQRIGAGEGRGLISITGQYQSVKQAKNKFARVKTLLKACPANVVDGTAQTSQSWAPLARMYRGRAVATWTVTKDSAEPDFLQYVAIRQTGAQLAFVRYSQQFEGGQPNPTQLQGLVEYLSAEVAERYRALL